MKLLELRAALAKIGAAHDNTEVKLWLPGSRISITNVIGPHHGRHDSKVAILLEGNVDEGSALDSLVEDFKPSG